MKKILVLGFTALTFGASAVLAQSGPSQQEQAACRSDAMKYCSSHIGKPAEMNACLKINKANLSDDCKKVTESRGG
ncbi:MAG: hypothetical protein CFE31_15670 [Rhizobiales bacterium PAR1]|nr:MAG: hypothetical protein CFE31_15670 [Rhizobiales bacterium PAR1]